MRYVRLCRYDDFRAGVRLGEHDLETDIDCMDEEGEEVCAQPYMDFDIEDTISHSGYSLSHLQNDIALIRIRGMADFRSGEIMVSSLTLCLT
jgi:hypothetical protein